MFKNPLVKKILSALGVTVFGYVFLNLTFIFDALFQGLLRLIFRLFTPVDLMMTIRWFAPLMHGLFLIVIGLISWAVFRSKLSVFLKAVYMTVPMAVALVTLGMFLFSSPLPALLLGALLVTGVLYYFYRTRQPWLYYYSVILVGFAMLLVGLLGVEI